MLVAELSFSLIRPVSPEAVDAVTCLCAAWHKNGQIEVEWQLFESPSQLLALALLPEAGSLDSAFNNEYVSRSLGQLSGNGVALPLVTIRGKSLDFPDACTCDVRPSLVLYTSMFSKASPLRCGACFLPVPLYRLPFSHDLEHLDVLHWAADYRACDTLQMHCTTGERFAEAQLALHDSALSRDGRAIATKLAAALGLPVYYFLHKARGRSRKVELERACPQCGSPWLLAERWHDHFDFRCDPCGLLSSVASSLAG
jgi:predicted  nucleic acid-binding Zn ribbon protein